MDDATPQEPVDLTELQRLLAVISPLPYWVEPQRDGGRLEDDAYIACGTRGDPSDTYDLIERYDVDTDYAYLVAAANAVPHLIHDLTTLQAREADYLKLLGHIAAGIQGYDGAVCRATLSRGVVSRLFEIDAMLAKGDTP